MKAPSFHEAKRFYQRFSWQTWITLPITGVGMIILLSGQSQNSPNLLLGRYSPRYAALLAGYAGVMLTAALCLSLPLPKLRSRTWIALIVIILCGVAWLPLLDHTWWQNFTLKLSLGWIVIALSSRLPFALPRYSLIALMTTALILNLSSVAAYPVIHNTDEGWTASFGLTFYQDGLYYARVNQGIYGIPQRYVPLANILPGYWMALFGVGWFQGRLMMALGGLILIAVTYRAALRLYKDRPIALLAALLLGGSSIFVRAAHVMRMDVFLALTAIFALSLMLDQTPHPTRAFLAGALLWVGIEFHQNAALLWASGAMIMVFSLFWHLVRARRLQVQRHQVMFFAGMSLAVLVYGIIHVLPDGGASLRQFSNQIRTRVEGMDQLAQSTLPLNEAFERLIDLVHFAPAEGLLVIGVLIGGLIKARTRGPTILLILVLILYRFVISTDVLLNYTSQFFPLVVLIAAGLLQPLIQRRGMVIITICTALLASMGVQAARHLYEDRNGQIFTTLREIASTLNPEEKIVALSLYTFVLPNARHLIIPFLPDYAAIAQSPVQGVAVWDHLQPDVFIVSTALAEPMDTPAQHYREQQRFVEVARYEKPLGCCILIYRRYSSAPQP